MPLIKPVTVHASAPVVVQVVAPGVEVTVYPVTGDPPSTDGAAHDTATSPLPAVAITAVGAPGTVTGGAVAVAVFDTANGPKPTLLIPATRNRYSTPFVNPVTVADVAATPGAAANVAVDHDIPSLLDCSTCQPVTGPYS